MSPRWKQKSGVSGLRFLFWNSLSEVFLFEMSLPKTQGTHIGFSKMHVVLTIRAPAPGLSTPGGWPWQEEAFLGRLELLLPASETHSTSMWLRSMMAVVSFPRSHPQTQSLIRTFWAAPLCLRPWLSSSGPLWLHSAPRPLPWMIWRKAPKNFNGSLRASFVRKITETYISVIQWKDVISPEKQFEGQGTWFPYPQHFLSAQLYFANFHGNSRLISAASSLQQLDFMHLLPLHFHWSFFIFLLFGAMFKCTVFYFHNEFDNGTVSLASHSYQIISEMFKSYTPILWMLCCS